MPPSTSGRHQSGPPDDEGWISDPVAVPGLPIEGAPSDDQKHRLEDWLAQLKIISRHHGILLDADDELRVIDMHTGHVLGMGLIPMLRQRGGRVRLSGYDVRDSILDGVWPIDTAQGLREQREAGRVWPRHPFRSSLDEE